MTAAAFRPLVGLQRVLTPNIAFPNGLNMHSCGLLTISGTSQNPADPSSFRFQLQLLCHAAGTLVRWLSSISTIDEILCVGIFSKALIYAVAISSCFWPLYPSLIEYAST